MGKAKLNLTLKGSGLEPGASYGASIKAVGPDGYGAKIGLGDQSADDTGAVVFQLAPALLQAVARAGDPDTVTVWIRHGGTDFNAPPVGSQYEVTLTVV